MISFHLHYSTSENVELLHKKSSITEQAILCHFWIHRFRQINGFGETQRVKHRLSLNFSKFSCGPKIKTGIKSRLLQFLYKLGHKNTENVFSTANCFAAIFG